MIRLANSEAGLALPIYSFEAENLSDDHPATGLTWYQMARFANWLNTREGFPPAYKFSFQPGEPGYSPLHANALWKLGDLGFNPSNNLRNRYARYVLPNLDEWYKAAFYSGTENNYSDFATGYDVVPNPRWIPWADRTEAIYDPPETVPVDWPPPPVPVYAAGNYNAGALIGSKGNHYKVVGMSGNVSEALEQRPLGVESATGPRLVIGGSWLSDAFQISSGRTGNILPNVTYGDIGFRVAKVEPSPALTNGFTFIEDNFDAANLIHFEGSVLGVPNPEELMVIGAQFLSQGGNPAACLEISHEYTQRYVDEFGEYSYVVNIFDSAVMDNRQESSWTPATEGTIELVRVTFDVMVPNGGIRDEDYAGDLPEGALVRPRLGKGNANWVDVSSAQDWVSMEFVFSEDDIDNADFDGTDPVRFGLDIQTLPSQEYDFSSNEHHVTMTQTVRVLVDNFKVQLQVADDKPLAERTNAQFSTEKAGFITVRTRPGRTYTMKASIDLNPSTAVQQGDQRMGTGGIIDLPFDGESLDSSRGFFWVEESE
ncbi:SUMF1/EgtB/PvdO family nonheme iron enzyme [Haloferula sp.]|uniref:SUMF1/EgtB/PvdO family nonheme iron enzyme n=1 Tax=Haloferula sp. TaxID=2497595 RepID=UPI003C744FF5